MGRSISDGSNLLYELNNIHRAFTRKRREHHLAQFIEWTTFCDELQEVIWGPQLDKSVVGWSTVPGRDRWNGRRKKDNFIFGGTCSYDIGPDYNELTVLIGSKERYVFRGHSGGYIEDGPWWDSIIEYTPKAQQAAQEFFDQWIAKAIEKQRQAEEDKLKIDQTWRKENHGLSGWAALERG